jgi:hypothetical protein
MNTSDALKLMVSSYPGGLDVVALRVGKNAETLRKELSGKDPKFKLGDATAQLISELCIADQSPNCHAYVNAVAAVAGGFVPLDVADGDPKPGGLMASTVGLVTGASQVLADVTAARADGLITDNERRVIERHVTGVIRDMQALLREVKRENESTKRGPAK